MVKDCITVDSLKKKIYQQNKNLQLIDFFKDYYGKNLDKARYNFCSSLAGYSLICYFLQIKDRHNGNILLHKDGYIIHIDFGFFLSNMPGNFFLYIFDFGNWFMKKAKDLNLKNQCLLNCYQNMFRFLEEKTQHSSRHSENYFIS